MPRGTDSFDRYLETMQSGVVKKNIAREVPRYGSPGKDNYPYVISNHNLEECIVYSKDMEHALRLWRRQVKEKEPYSIRQISDGE